MTLSFVRQGQSGARSYPGLLVLMGVACVLAFGQPAAAQDVSSRLKRLENEIETLSRAVYRGETPPPGSLSSGAASADTEIRLQQMERELREMRGLIEERNHEVRQLRAELERVKGDLQLQIDDMKGGSTGPVSGTAPQDSQSGGYKYTTGRGGSSSSSSSGSGTLGSYVQKPDGGLSGSTSDAASLYDNAFALVKNAQYGAAEKEFSAFLNQYPDHVLAGNAKYWLGETYYVRGEFEKAARVFAEGYQQYPQGAKVADNLLKLGMSLAGLGKTDDACVALGQLFKGDIKAGGSVERRAEQEMQRLGC